VREAVCRRSGDSPWRIATLNLVGSVFFGISAVTSFILPDTGEVLNADATNATTFLGAVCFLAGGAPDAARRARGEAQRRARMKAVSPYDVTGTMPSLR
jgi:hypothetical protein